MKIKYLTVGLLLTLIIVPLLTLNAVVAQNCTIRADWPIYTVVRGDNLYRIARRYNTTVAVLANANCLTNVSRIFAGQQLRVPSGVGVPGGTIDVPSTFQQYERGFMIWRGDTGDVLVFTGTASGSSSRYASQSYGRLPENAVPDPTPAGLVRPIMGFGRVWGNFIPVRTALGWATTPERSFTMRYTSAGGQIYLSLPDGRNLINSAGTWSIFSGNIPTPIPPTPLPATPPPSTVYVSGVYQPFEGGFMTWRSDTGEIAVYYGLNGGGVAAFSVASYGNLPDNPFVFPPPGRIRPIWGIGRVWGNYEVVRNQLGWATGQEVNYVITYTLVPNGYTFNLTNGSVVTNINNRTWSLSGTLPSPVPNPTAPVPPTATPIQQTSVTVNTAYQLFENGFLIWRSDTGRITLFTTTYVSGFNQDQYANLPDNPITDAPPIGRFKPVSGFGRVWGNFPDVRNALGWGLGTESGYQATFRSRDENGLQTTCFNLPDGRLVKFPIVIERSWTWLYVDTCN